MIRYMYLIEMLVVFLIFLIFSHNRFWIIEIYLCFSHPLNENTDLSSASVYVVFRNKTTAVTRAKPMIVQTHVPLRV